MAAKIISTEPLETKDAKWINLVKITYTNDKGHLRTWEAMRRPTRPEGSAVDGVQCIAILQKPTGPEILLEKQFRPPVGKTVIELPSGLVDEGETAEEAAVRELKEETGYVGEMIPDAGGRRLVSWNSPASSCSCTYVIHLKIDLTKPENQNPKPELEEGECIECFSLPLKNLQDELRNLEEQGFAVDGKVGAIAEGLQLASAFGV